MHRRKSSLLIIAIVLCFGYQLCAQSVQITQPSIESFNEYVSHAEGGMQTEMQAGRLFWIDNLPQSERGDRYERLRKGEILIERVSGQTHIPGGLVHHWEGMIFFPKTSLARTLQLLQSYRNYENVYAPAVLQSRLKVRRGNEFDISLRLKQKKVLTVALNTDYTVQYFSLNPDEEFIRSQSTRIAEVENPGEPNEKEKPVGNDGGFLWRLYSYWRLRETEQGTFAQCESISLSRPIPSGLGWLVGPFVESIPKDSLRFTLEATRKALRSGSE